MWTKRKRFQSMLNLPWFSVWQSRKRAHSVLWNLWAENWHTGRNGTLLSNELIAHSQDTWERCQHTLQDESPSMWQLGGECGPKKKNASVPKGKSFELTPKRKRETVIRLWQAAVFWPERHIILSSHLSYSCHPLSFLARRWWWCCLHEW